MKSSCNNYTIVEMIFALGLMVLLTACFFSSLKMLREMNASFTTENRGLSVLDNTLERLESIKAYDSKKAEQIFLDEYRKSCLARNDKVRPDTKKENGIIWMRIMKTNNKALAEVKLKCPLE